MQERKFDKNQLIGFGLMLLLFFGYFMLTKPTEEEIQERRAQQELAQEQEQAAQEQVGTAQTSDIPQTGLSSDSFSENPTVEQTFVLENEHLLLEFNSRGAQLTKVELKQFK